MTMITITIITFQRTVYHKKQSNLNILTGLQRSRAKMLLKFRDILQAMKEKSKTLIVYQY